MVSDRLRTGAYTMGALVAFAANSVLCRIALHDATIDPATFSSIRIVSGAVMLLAFTASIQRPSESVTGSWTAAALLALYAVPFSFAYTGLTTGTGALILFASVQVTMIAAGLRSGEKPHPLQWLGLSIALTGLVVLVLPGLTAPPVTAAFLMAIAGAAWGVYSWIGRGTTSPLAQTTGNFVRAVPFVIAVSLVTLPRLHMESRGVLLAVASGAIASGLGYVVWYAALHGLTAMQAAVVQLSVPILAAIGGIIFLAEAVSTRLVISTVMVLGGIALAIIRGMKVQSRQRSE
jgi:drug/metabolite transporter (DMT)-like permease